MTMRKKSARSPPPATRAQRQQQLLWPPPPLLLRTSPQTSPQSLLLQLPPARPLYLPPQLWYVLTHKLRYHSLIMHSGEPVEQCRLGRGFLCG